MRSILIASILFMTIPAAGLATEAPGAGGTAAAGQNPGANAPDAQGDAPSICLRATKKFEEQEMANGNRSIEPGSLSAPCKDSVKPAPYWLCMDHRAAEKIDMNSAHWQCAKETNLL